MQGEIRVYRPSDAALDQVLPVTESPVLKGLYQARFEKPVKGLWQLTWKLQRADSRFTTTLRHVLE